MNGISGINSLYTGQTAFESAKISAEKGNFENLLREMNGVKNTSDGKKSLPVGAAANQANENVPQRYVDRTSELYEKALELESFIVKMMVSSMRKTIIKADGEGSFAQRMYEDMLFDEYTTALTKNAGFGLADEVYLQLSSSYEGENFSAEA